MGRAITSNNAGIVSGRAFLAGWSDYLLRSNQPLWPAVTTAQSMAVSPTARYRVTHFFTSLLLSPTIFSSLNVGLGTRVSL